MPNQVKENSSATHRLNEIHAAAHAYTKNRPLKKKAVPTHKQSISRRDGAETSFTQVASFHNDPLTGQNPGGTINFTDLEKSQFFTIFMAIGEMGKAFRTQSNTSTTLMGLSTRMTQELEGYLTRQVAMQKIQAAAVGAYNAAHPTWLKYMEQVAGVLVAGLMAGMSGGIAGAIAVGVIGAVFTALDDVKVHKKDGQTETFWDYALRGCSPKAKGWLKLLIIVAVSIAAGGLVGFTFIADEVIDEATSIAEKVVSDFGEEGPGEELGGVVDGVDGQTSEVSEDNATLKKTSGIKNKAGARAFLVAIDAVSKMLGSMRTHDVTKGNEKDTTFGMFGDLALAWGASPKDAKKWDTGFSWGISIALMVVQFGGTYALNKVTQTVEQGEWMQRFFNATDYLDGATQAISSGAQAVTSGISAHYAQELETISKNLTELEKDGALVELLKTSINGATKASMQQMQGIMDAIIAAIEGYSTQLSQGV